MLVEDGGRIALVATAAQVVHCDIEINLAARSLDADHHGFGVAAAREALIVDVNFGGKDFEAKALVIEQGYGISDDHVGQLADGFASELLGSFDRAACEVAGDFYGDFGGEV